MWLLVLSVGCLERVTGEAVPLDPRFYAAAEAAQGSPETGGGAAIPFSSYDGEMVTVRGVVASPVEDSDDIPVDLDVRVPDPTAEGGIDAKGKLLLDGPGPFELRVPKGLGRLELQAFQDLDSDGPTAPDPFAGVWLEVGDVDIEDVSLEMVVGAGGRDGGPIHTEAAPGAPGGASVAGGSAGGGEQPAGEPPPHEHTPGAQGTPPSEVPQGPGGIEPFVGYDGPTITLSGTLTCSACPTVDLDLFKPGEAGQQRDLLGKLKLKPGPFTVTVPRDLGPLVLEAFYDVEGNGPGQGDPRGSYSGNPLRIGRSDVGNVNITLSVQEGERMPDGIQRPPPPPGGGGL